MYLKFSGILVLNEFIEMSMGICQRIHSKKNGLTKSDQNL